MRARLLGWAGVQLSDAGSTLVIDPLADPGAVWAWMGDGVRDVPLPEVVPAEPAGAAALALVTHAHLDHADAGALTAALAPGAPVLTAASIGGSAREQAGVAVGEADLAASGLPRRDVAPWERLVVDGWTVTALPAVDGTGDPQVSWLVQRGGASVVHGGDTLAHHWWWRVAERAGGSVDVAFLPVNGARLTFRHRQPPSPRPGAMDGEAAVLAAAQLRAGTLVPVHYGAYAIPGIYEPDPDAPGTVARAAAEHGVAVATPPLGEWFDVRTPVAA